MRKIIYILNLLCFQLITDCQSVESEYPLHTDDLFVRDPFIYTDPNTQLYYLHVNHRPAIGVYESPNLVNWKSVGKSFIRDSNSDFWGVQDFWAPDVYYYNGKYYLFVTFSNPSTKRGTSILVSNTITGPFEPLVNQPVTPAEWQCLDGSLYIDDQNQPWLLFCREWIEVINGEVYAQKLLPDLTAPEGDPILLFKASEAPWTGPISYEEITGYVTDAPFIYKASNGKIILLWSSFTKKGKYAIGTAYSENGEITGNWIQNPYPINADNGGHAMVFIDHNDQKRISYHSPNSGPCRGKYLWLEEYDHNLMAFDSGGIVFSEDFEEASINDNFIGNVEAANFGGGANWSFGLESSEPISGTKSAYLNILNSGNEWWNLQFKMESRFAVLEGVQYEVSFKIRSSVSTKIMFKVEATADFTHDLDLPANNTQTYNFITCPMKRSGDDPNFQFSLGNSSSPAELWIDDIVIKMEMIS